MLVNGLNAIKPRFARPAVEEGSVGVAMVDGSEGLNTDFDDMIFD